MLISSIRCESIFVDMLMIIFLLWLLGGIAVIITEHFNATQDSIEVANHETTSDLPIWIGNAFIAKFL